ncbi:MAG: acyltransferase [Pirellulales bacterium]|nr:acyltransferase [Pirellulales bacterium]
MATTSTLEPSPPVPEAPAQPPRLWFVDNLRVFIIIVVLTHHMGNPYGSRGWWYYMLPESQPTSKATSRLMMLNPSFTMAVLLTFSGYLLPTSFDRRGMRSYTVEKFIRLGIPLLLGGMVMLPLLQYYAFHMHWGYRGYASFWDYYAQAWMGWGERPPNWNGPGWPDRNLGHLWYIEHLLFYSVCYGLWRWWFAPGTTRAEHGPLPGHLAILGYGILIGLITFAVRIFWSYNDVTTVLGFLQIDMSHLPQWLPFFFVGLAAYRYQWLYRLPARTGYVWFAVAVALAAFNVFVAVLPWFEPYFLSLTAHHAGFTLPNFCKSMWESLWCTSAAVGLIVVFREHLQVRLPLTVAMAASAYAVHVFHPPMVVGLQFAMDSWNASAFTKYAVGSLLSVVLCYGVAHWFILRIPYARRIL